MLAVAALAALVYVNALHNPFVYDDRLTVVENPSLEDLGDLRRIFLRDVFRPVLNLSYAVDHAMWGLDPFGFHLTSVLLHVVNVCLLLVLARRAEGDRRERHEDGLRLAAASGSFAFVAAGLLAVHPLMTEAVGYVSGRSEVLCTTFVLTAFLALRRYLVAGGCRWLAAGLATFVLALGSKEVAAGLPFLLLAYDRWVLPGSVDDRRRRLRRFHVPLITVISVAGALRVTAFVIFEAPGELVNLWWNLLVEAVVVWRYCLLLVLPAGQSIVHDVRSVDGFFDPVVALALVGLAAVVVALVAAWRRGPTIAFGLTWFLLLLAPSHIIPLVEPMAEHRIYAASCGVFIAAAAVAQRVSKWLATRGIGAAAQAVCLLLPVLVALSILTVSRNRVWSDEVTLWRDAVGKAPNTWAAQYSLGNALRGDSRCEEAIPSFRRAVEILPHKLDAYWNLGICLAETGRLEDARSVLEAALDLDATHPKTHNNLGMLLWLAGDPDGAERHFRLAMTHDPDNVRARQLLARLCEMELRDPARALALYREILAIAPSTPGVRNKVTQLQGRPAAGQQE